MTEPTAYATLDGHALETCSLHVGAGTWLALCKCVDAPELSGEVVLQIGAQQLLGAVLEAPSATHGLRAEYAIEPRGNWALEVERRDYHNDAGVLSRRVAEDAAADVGARIGRFEPERTRLGKDYARQARSASATLEDVAGDVPWHVDYESVTHVGPRERAPFSSYELQSYSPMTGNAVLALDEIAGLAPGSLLSKQLDDEVEVTYVIFEVDGEGVRALVDTEPPVTEQLRALVRRMTDKQLLGKYRYRVVSQAVDGRLELQAVRKDLGLPDLRPLSMVPGVAGAHVQLEPGAIVYIEFADGGDRSQPIVTGFASQQEAGHTPIALSFAGSTSPAARMGDSVEVSTPVFVRIVGAGQLAAGVTYPVSFSSDAAGAVPVTKLDGVITSGSTKVSL